MCARSPVRGVLLVALVTLGCGEAEPKKGVVTGDVTLNGEPVKTALVTFTAGSGEVVGSAPVSDGKYRTEVPVGDVVVRVTGVRELKFDEAKLKRGFKPTEEDMNPEVFPAKYNKDSTLRLTVKEGENKQDIHAQIDLPKKKR